MHQGVVQLRIDDLDVDRCKPEFIQGIIDQLEAIGIDWDFGPKSLSEHQNKFSQPLKFDGYLSTLESRLQKGERIFSCECTRKMLSQSGESGPYPGNCRDKGIPLAQDGVSWRILLHTDTITNFEDHTYGRYEVDLAKVSGDYIVRRKDGIPAYHLVSLIEDLEGSIDLIVRGEDLLESTATQLDLAKRLGIDSFGQSRFLHHPVLVRPDGTKLSKSRNDPALSPSELAKPSTRKQLFAEYLRWAGLGMRAQPNTANEILELVLKSSAE